MSDPSCAPFAEPRNVQTGVAAMQVARGKFETQLSDKLEQAENQISAELNSQPLVTVVIPTYNREAVVLRAVESALQQTYRNIEILVVDDGSTDHTVQALSVFQTRIQILRQTNQGASAARNRAIVEARGKYVAFLDSDDEWLPTKLERQIALLESRPDLSFVACLSKNERKTYAEYDSQDSHFLKFIRQPFTSNVTRYVVRRECFEQHGLFDTSINGPEDLEMWLRLLKNGCRFGYVAEPLVIYSYSQDAISSRPAAMLAGESIIRARYIETLPHWWQRRKLRNWFTARSYMHASFCYRDQGKLGTSLRYLMSSFLLSPLGPRNRVRLSALLVTLKLIAIRMVRRPPSPS